VIDFEYDDIDGALADSVRALCGARLAQPSASAQGVLDTVWWRELADLGVLGLATEVGGGTVTTVAASMEQLGYFDAPGPLVETFAGTQVLPADHVESVAAGTSVVTVTSSNLVPWLAAADLIVEFSGGEAYLAKPSGPADEVSSLAHEPWGRCTLERLAPLGDATRAVAVGDVAAGAYLVGEATQLLSAAAAYASDRVQFKTPIASFQAISHPLADCYLQVTAARALVRRAAYVIDTASPDAVSAAATARRSATRAALATAWRAHQTYGAMGFTVEGPIGNRSAKIRQVSLAATVAGSGDRILTRWGL